MKYVSSFIDPLHPVQEELEASMKLPTKTRITLGECTSIPNPNALPQSVRSCAAAPSDEDAVQESIRKACCQGACKRLYHSHDQRHSMCPPLSSDVPVLVHALLVAWLGSC
eukprot:gnl/MRDRNA2_/MRDRNA2_393788_c0_seq1.p1 gnl/MRDRNA2_/MRDRNA2_393788_c0~~gnl/MRDRNA2_/MRDRNA2_393788_c0_seq1.p1  ORF type:complete len:111 (+),score=9.96 gnl/MRDRNA2_/MRDRNA2_393788_c0_seq1:197-529(+)